MNFGPETSKQTASRSWIARWSWVHFFDTANVYGWKLGEGVTEQIVGRWLRRRGAARAMCWPRGLC
jgi:NDP-hexose 2,3-enoyl reductase